MLHSTYYQFMHNISSIQDQRPLFATIHPEIYLAEQEAKDLSPSPSAVASGKVPIFVINLDAVTDSKLGVGFEEWERKRREREGGLGLLLLLLLHRSPLNACYQNIQFRALHSEAARPPAPAQGNPRPQFNDKPDRFG